MSQYTVTPLLTQLQNEADELWNEFNLLQDNWHKYAKGDALKLEAELHAKISVKSRELAAWHTENDEPISKEDLYYLLGR